MSRRVASPHHGEARLPGLGTAVDRPGRELRKRFLDDVAPQLLALQPHALQMDLDDEHAQMPSMVPVPGDELPVRACVSIWVDAHDDAGAYEAILARRPACAAPATSSPSRCTATTATTSTPAARLARRHAFAGDHHADRLRQAGRRRRRDVLRPLVRPPVADVGVACSRAPATSATRSCARSHPARRATARSSRSRGRASSTSRTCTRSSARPSTRSSARRIRIMLDSTKLLYDPATMRNYPLSEYILKTP